MTTENRDRSSGYEPVRRTVLETGRNLLSTPPTLGSQLRQRFATEVNPLGAYILGSGALALTFLGGAIVATIEGSIPGILTGLIGMSATGIQLAAVGTYLQFRDNRPV